MPCLQDQLAGFECTLEIREWIVFRRFRHPFYHLPHNVYASLDRAAGAKHPANRPAGSSLGHVPRTRGTCSLEALLATAMHTEGTVESENLQDVLDLLAEDNSLLNSGEVW